MRWIGIGGIVLAATIGLAAGVGGYTLVYARCASYLTNDPAACVNCHVMREQFDGWIASSYRTVAVCNDCHAGGRADPRGVDRLRAPGPACLRDARPR